MIKENAMRAVFEGAMKLKREETCLIVTDTIKKDIGLAFYEYAKKCCKNAEIIIIEPTREHGCEPPKNISDMMLKYDVQLLITEKSLTHTAARRMATLKGARIATMPSITEDIANRCLDVDYGDLKEKSNKMYTILKSSGKIRVMSRKGTDMIFRIGESKFFGKDGGSFDFPGSFGNLPEGEVSFAPSESNGVYLVDASFPGLGLLDSPITFKVENGRVIGITGKRAEEIISRLDAVGPDAYLVAELGIGLNPSAKIIGNILEDEKVIGTVHVAVGNNCTYGGKNDVPLHLDGVITEPSIVIDDRIIMHDGVFV